MIKIGCKKRVVKKSKKTFTIFKINYTLAKLFETPKSNH